MKRRMFNLLRRVSLLLFIGTLALWVRSHFVYERLWIPLDSSHGADPAPPEVVAKLALSRNVPGTWYLHRSIEIESAGGLVCVKNMCVVDGRARHPEPWTHWDRLDGLPQRDLHQQAMGFGWGWPGRLSKAVLFPWWLPSLLFAVVPLAWLGQHLRVRRRRRAGECQSCGYNLTGNVSGVCPECGMAIPPAAGGGPQAAKEGST